MRRLGTILGQLGTIFESPFPQFGPSVDFRRFSHEPVTPWAALFDTFSERFFFSSFRDTKKGGPGGPPKLDPFFGPFGGLPGGPQEGSLCSDSSILTFAAGPKKGSKMEPKWSHLGSPRGHYTHFWGNFFAQKAPCWVKFETLFGSGSKSEN